MGGGRDCDRGWDCDRGGDVAIMQLQERMAVPQAKAYIDSRFLFIMAP